MVFSSITFLFYFLPVVIGTYYLAAGCGMKNIILLTASLFFYAWGEPVYIALMLFSIFFNYGAGRVLDARKNQRKRRIIFGTALAVNLLLLAFFKYADFLILTVNHIFGTAAPQLHLPLPVGISFYTFQALSYLADLYNGRVRVQKNGLDFAVYIAMFPQLIAGPIVRLQSVEHDLHERQHSAALFASGVRRFTVGLGKKVLLANQAGLLWDAAAGQTAEISAVSAWIGILGFTFQIYFDFSGYSDMAIGLGKMFGFVFPENFKYPYLSGSITEFWRRWHISLGSWFREYVYIPLGGNRCGLFRQILHIAIVWFLTGLWHGAGLNFICWGLYFAVILTAEKLFLLRILEGCPIVIRRVYTMFLVILSWVIFSKDSAAEAFSYLGAMFGGNGIWLDEQALYLISGNALLLLVLAVGSTDLPAKGWLLLRENWNESGDENKTRNRNKKVVCLGQMAENLLLLLLLYVSSAYITASTYNPFLYFRF